jgi:hypothetical protein
VPTRKAVFIHIRKQMHRGERRVANNFLSRQINRLANPRRSGIIFCGCVLYALLVFLKYIAGTKQGNLQDSIFYPLLFSIFLTRSILTFTTSRVDIPGEHVPWHRQPFVIVRLYLLTMTLLALIFLINSFIPDGLPETIGDPIEAALLLLLLLVYLRSFTLPRTKTGGAQDISSHSPGS